MIELVVILLFKDNVLELRSERTYTFFFLFKGDMSIHPEKGYLSNVDEEMWVCSKRRKDISQGQILWSSSLTIYALYFMFYNNNNNKS